MDINNCISQERIFLSRNAQLIEKILGEFGIVTRIADIKIEPKQYEYQLEIAIGTDLEKLENHSRDLALALASPTGKVEMIIPIPGRSLVGIQVPRPSEKEIMDMKLEELNPIIEQKDGRWRGLMATPFYLTAYLFGKIGDIISNQRK